MSQEKRKPLKEMDLSTSIPKAIPEEEWRILFDEPDKMKSIASQLIKSGLGKRKVKNSKGKYVAESDTEYMMRVQYCAHKGIPYCMINNATYILKGKVSEMAEWKLDKFNRAYPNCEWEILVANEKCISKRVRTAPDQKWVTVRWTIEKAKILGLYMEGKKQWTENSMSMLSARCDTQLVDIAGGSKTRSSGYLSVDEINEQGIEL